MSTTKVRETEDGLLGRFKTINNSMSNVGVFSNATTADDQIHQILYELGRIEGRLIEINSISKRFSVVEMSVSWIKRGWAMLAAAAFYLYRLAGGKL